MENCKCVACSNSESGYPSTTPTEHAEVITIDKALFKEILQLLLNLPEFRSKLTAIDVDLTTTPTGEALMRLQPGDFLLRLNAALRACR